MSGNTIPQQEIRDFIPEYPERVPPSPRPLSSPARTYVAEMIKLIRAANLKANAFSAAWSKLNDEVNDRLDRQGITDIKQRFDIKSKNLGLMSEFDAYKFWAGEVQRLTAALEAEKTAREMWSW